MSGRKTTAANSAIMASAITAAATTKTELPNSSGGRIGSAASPLHDRQSHE